MNQGILYRLNLWLVCGLLALRDPNGEITCNVELIPSHLVKVAVAVAALERHGAPRAAATLGYGLELALVPGQCTPNTATQSTLYRFE